LEEPPPRIQQALAAPVAAPPDVQQVLNEEMAPPPKVTAEKPALAPPKIKPVSVKPAAHDAAADLRKYTVKISNHDYERLGILAVKQGKSRQRLLQETVNNLFSGLTEEYGASCQCLGKCG
jgi:hypothetical protein